MKKERKKISWIEIIILLGLAILSAYLYLEVLGF
jgi:flagellar basal body-associated protein FliL